MVSMYKRWWKKINAAARTPGKQSWRHVTGYDVVPIRADPILLCIGRAIDASCYQSKAVVSMKAVWSQGQRKRRIAHLARDSLFNRRCAIFCIAESLSFFLHGDKDGGVLFTVAKSDIK